VLFFGPSAIVRVVIVVSGNMSLLCGMVRTVAVVGAVCMIRNMGSRIIGVVGTAVVTTSNARRSWNQASDDRRQQCRGNENHGSDMHLEGWLRRIKAGKRSGQRRLELSSQKDKDVEA